MIKDKIAFLILIISICFVSVSCTKDEDEYSEETEQTVFMYMPWSTNLTSYFYQNIADLETALQGNILKNNRLVVFFATSSTEATMFEIKEKKGKITQITLKKYTNPTVTTTEGITSILNDVLYFAPASHYAMIISCHGMGWLPVPGSRSRMLSTDQEKNYWEHEGAPLTRYFGGTTSDVQTNTTSLADAITKMGIRMDYILFDDCYMSSIEVAYDLRNATDYLIASPTEVMAYGFPYHIIGKHLIGNVDLKGICEGFHNYYENYKHPYGTIGVTVTAELDHLAVIMKEINQKFSFDESLLNNVQQMDGYLPVLFFDMGDYVSKLCTDTTLLERFESQLKKTVPSDLSLHTQKYYSMSKGAIEIKSFSGVTTSDPSISTKAVGKTETAWWKATH